MERNVGGHPLLCLDGQDNHGLWEDGESPLVKLVERGQAEVVENILKKRSLQKSYRCRFSTKGVRHLVHGRCDILSCLKLWKEDKEGRQRVMENIFDKNL